MKNLTLLDLVDKLLEKGAVVKGDVVLSAANVDLVYLNLQLLLSSIATLNKGLTKGSDEELNFVVDQLAKGPETSGSKEEFSDLESFEPLTEIKELDFTKKQTNLEDRAEKSTRIKMNEKNVEKGLAKLVLVLVDLLRKLMERQAVRKMELGQLSASETERIGRTFLLLDKRIKQLQKVFHLEDEDLNLNLGPLGNLT